jgi:hypothetical protein
VFLSVWLAGDVTNLIGASWAGLVPTVIALAVYFCIADFVLISQCIYYNVLNERRSNRSRTASQATEVDPLLPELSRQNTDSSIGLPGSHRRRRSSASVTQNRDSILTRALEQIIEEDGTESNESWVRNVISVFLVCLVGAGGWALAYKSGVWTPVPEEGDIQESKSPIGAQIFGYISAVCYLG